MSKHPMRLCIMIEGESAENLFAVGPNDIKSYFLPKGLKVKPSDVKQITFRQVAETDANGVPTHWKVHQENFSKKMDGTGA